MNLFVLKIRAGELNGEVIKSRHESLGVVGWIRRNNLVAETEHVGIQNDRTPHRYSRCAFRTFWAGTCICRFGHCPFPTPQDCRCEVYSVAYLNETDVLDLFEPPRLAI